MRADIVPGALFPDFELSDHTGKHRTLSDVQGQIPWSSCSAGEDTAQRTAARQRVLSNFTTRWKSVTPA